MHMEEYKRESASDDNDIMNIWGYCTISHMMAQSHSQAYPGNETNLGMRLMTAMRWLLGSL